MEGAQCYLNKVNTSFTDIVLSKKRTETPRSHVGTIDQLSQLWLLLLGVGSGGTQYGSAPSNIHSAEEVRCYLEKVNTSFAKTQSSRRSVLRLPVVIPRRLADFAELWLLLLDVLYQMGGIQYGFALSLISTPVEEAQCCLDKVNTSLSMSDIIHNSSEWPIASISDHSSRNVKSK